MGYVLNDIEKCEQICARIDIFLELLIIKIKKTLIDFRALNFKLAGVVGLEPTSTVLETAILAFGRYP